MVGNRLIGGSVKYFHAKNIGEEANFIVESIEKNIFEGWTYSQQTILYRAHSVSRRIEEELLKKNIPYKIFSGVGFYQRKEIKDILAYMRLLIDGDDISFMRVANSPKRSFGKKTMGDVKKYAEENSLSLVQSFLDLSVLNSTNFKNPEKKKFAKLILNFKKNFSKFLESEEPLIDILMYILEETNYEEILRNSGEDERLDNLSEFKQSLVDYQNSFVGEKVSVEEYLQGITLLTSQDQDSGSDKVNLMTIHTAKGLEFPVVYVMGMNEGIFPSSRVINHEQMEEERRLAYVALTRAKDKIFITDAEGVNNDGSVRYPSRFIFDIGQKGIEYLNQIDKSLFLHYNNINNEDNQSGPNLKFKTGELVLHNQFGVGKIISLSGNYAEVDFEDKNVLKISQNVLKKFRQENDSKSVEEKLPINDVIDINSHSQLNVIKNSIENHNETDCNLLDMSQVEKTIDTKNTNELLTSKSFYSLQEEIKEEKGINNLNNDLNFLSKNTDEPLTGKPFYSLEEEIEEEKNQNKEKLLEEKDINNSNKDLNFLSKNTKELVVDVEKENVVERQGADKINDNFMQKYEEVDRNEPCPCGSGKMFKNCHGLDSNGVFNKSKANEKINLKQTKRETFGEKLKKILRKLIKK